MSYLPPSHRAPEIPQSEQCKNYLLAVPSLAARGSSGVSARVEALVRRTVTSLDGLCVVEVTLFFNVL